VLALFGARLHPFLPLVTLTAIDRHIGQAFASYEKRLAGRAPALRAARRMIGKAWLRLLPFVPARDAARWSLILRIAARWDPATLPSAILARVIQPLRAAMARD
jgi:hypothetical protein